MTIYNYEQFVTEAINSVLAQDFSDFEIIAVDDGSQDSSWEKINMIRLQVQMGIAKIVMGVS